MKILSFGEILWDIYPEQTYIGGAPLNFAAHLAKHGEEVYLLSAVGDDKLGRDALSRLKEWGCQTKYVAILKQYSTVRCMVTLHAHSVPSYQILQDVAFDHIPHTTISENFDLLYFGTLALRNNDNFSQLKRLIEEHHFPEILADVNVRLPFCSKESMQFSAQHATVLKISTEELPIVAEYLGIVDATDETAFCKHLSASLGNLNCIVITRGSEGAYAWDCRNGRGYDCLALKSDVSSTVGAGDSFSASFIYWYLRGKEIPYCLDYATKVAGYVVSKFEAVPDYNMEQFLF